MNQQMPNYNQQGQNFNQQAPNFNQQAPNFNQPTPNYQPAPNNYQPTPNYNQPNPGYNRPVAVPAMPKFKVNLTLKSIILAGIALFIVVALLLMPFVSYSKADQSKTIGDILDAGGGTFVTFAIFSTLCAIGLIVAPFIANKKTVVGTSVAGFVMLLTTIFTAPDWGDYVGFGAGIWVALILYIAAVAVAILEVPALNKSLQ